MTQPKKLPKYEGILNEPMPWFGKHHSYEDETGQIREIRSRDTADILAEEAAENERIDALFKAYRIDQNAGPEAWKSLALAMARAYITGFQRGSKRKRGRPTAWLEWRGLQFWADVEVRRAKTGEGVAEAAAYIRDNSDLRSVFFEDKIEDGLRAFKRNIRKSEAVGHVFEDIAVQHHNLPPTVSKKERAELTAAAEAKWVIENFGYGRIFGEEPDHLLTVFGVKTGENSD